MDTFPYAGTTTTCESLYMGVPCITMMGKVHAHNVGVTLLHQVGKYTNITTFFFHSRVICNLGKSVDLAKFDCTFQLIHSPSEEAI